MALYSTTKSTFLYSVRKQHCILATRGARLCFKTHLATSVLVPPLSRAAITSSTADEYFPLNVKASCFLHKPFVTDLPFRQVASTSV